MTTPENHGSVGTAPWASNSGYEQPSAPPPYPGAPTYPGAPPGYYPPPIYSDSGYPGTPYPPPAYPGYSAPAANTPPKRRRLVRIVSILVSAIFFATTYAIVQHYVFHRLDGASGPIDTFTMPKTALGLPQSTDPTALDLARNAQTELVNKGAARALAEVYQNPHNKTDLLVLIATSTMIGDLSDFSDGVYAGMGEDVTLKPKKAYSAGAAGGVMWCADGSVSANGRSVTLAVCSITDKGGSLMIIYFGHSGGALAAVAPKLRSVVEH